MCYALCTYAFAYAYTYAYMCICEYVYMFVCICICVYIYRYIYIYICNPPPPVPRFGSVYTVNANRKQSFLGIHFDTWFKAAFIEPVLLLTV